MKRATNDRGLRRSYHSHAKYWSATEEKLVIVRRRVRSSCYAAEPVQVELSLEAGQLALFKVFPHHLIREDLRLFADERAAVGTP